MKVLVKKEYHGQIWFEVEDAPVPEGFGRRSSRGSERNGRRIVGDRNPSENRNLDRRPVQSSKRLSSLG